jgi:hypothetical protein
MTDTYMKNGSFVVNIPVGRKKISDDTICLFPKEFEQIDKNTYTVNMLNQHELADGWVQTLPFPSSVKRKIKHIDENEVETTVERFFIQRFKMRVNLAQLPHNLWHRIKCDSRYNEDSFIVKNRIYSYLVEKTAVDKEIRELYYLTTLPKTPENCENIKELLVVLKDNDVYGWVVIRARNYIHA